MLTCCFRYKIAGRVSERLDEMGKDLTSMIDEINDASATISKTSKPDDPVSSMTICCEETNTDSHCTAFADRPRPEWALIAAAID